MQCPVCKSEISGESIRCPTCSAELGPLLDIKSRAETLLQQAHHEFQQGNYASVLSLAQEASDLDGDRSADSKILSTRALLELREFDSALFEITGLEDNEEAQKLRDTLLSEKRRDQAAKENYNLALIKARRGYLLEAKRLLEKAVELAPYLTLPYLLMVKVQLKMGRTDEAAQYLRMASAFEPRDDHLRELQMLIEVERKESRIKSFYDRNLMVIWSLLLIVLILELVLLLTR